jgi:transposase
MAKKPLNNYRSRLIQARSTLGKSEREMAAALLTSRSTYQQWEAGTRRTPGIAVLAAEMLVSQKDFRVGPRHGSLGDRILAALRPGITYRDLADLCGVKLTTIHQTVYHLRRRGISVPVKTSTRGTIQVREHNEDRAKRIIAAIEDGATLREIAAKENITHQYVAQIADKMDGRRIRAIARARARNPT